MPEITLPQGTIRYEDRGAGVPLVLVHGFATDSRLWRKVAPLLAAQARVIAPDLPLGSHQRAMRPEADLTPPGVARLLADLLDALDLHDAVLVGNDTGGAICQIAAANHPDRLGGLVLTNCDAFERFPPPAFRYLQPAARVPGALRLLALSLAVRPLRRLPIAYGDVTTRPIDRDVLDAWVAPLRRDAGVRRDTAKLLRGISTSQTFDAAQRLASFDRPALIAWGTRDRHFTPGLALRLRATIPDAELTWIEGARTFVMEDAPQELAELVLRFVRERVAAPAPVV